MCPTESAPMQPIPRRNTVNCSGDVLIADREDATAPASFVDREDTVATAPAFIGPPSSEPCRPWEMTP